jgi:hypothetical protein
MGLNIGVNVKRQEEGFMSYGSNPKGTPQEIEREFDTFLRGKYPEARMTPSVCLNADDTYDFDVRLDYAWNNYDSTPMYMAILEYVLKHFSAGYGIDMHIYRSP